MVVQKNEKYTRINSGEDSAEMVLNKIKENNAQFLNEHLIIDFSENINTNIEELNLFLDISIEHLENGTSFVIVCSGIDIDDIPDEINVVPTFTEAEDILSMDEITRDLGF